MANAKFRTPQPINEPVRPYAPGSAEKNSIKQTLKAMRKEPIEIPVVVGGRHLKTGKTVKITAPHNHALNLATCHQAGADEAAEAVKCSQVARREWAAMHWEDRAAVFLKAADLLAGKYRNEMNAATMLGQSKTVYQAEIDSACELIDFFRFNVHFMEKIYEEQPFSPPGQWNRSEARGLEGFVFASTPFNFTSIAVNLPMAPALMGCSVVWKPAQTSVLSSWVGFKILEEAGLPPGVINFVPGDAKAISEILLKNPQLSGIHFTGSTATFNHLWRKVGENLDNYNGYPRLVGETGGKDFVFAHPSADPEALVVALVRGAFEYQGQKCSAASRAFIPKSLWAKVKEPLIGMTNELKMGDPEDFTNFVGAVIDQKSFDRNKKYIDEAKHSPNAKVIAGGACDSTKGWFIRPTIIEALDPAFKTMREEIFGPVLTIYVYDDKDLDKALELCDQGSPYALTGAIFARDRRDIARMSDALSHTAGNFYINDKPTGAVVGQQPFGGGRASGTNDKAGSMYNLLRWVSFRTVKETFVPPVDYRYPFMGEI